MMKATIRALTLGVTIILAACGPSRHHVTCLRAIPVIGQLMNESVSTFCRDGDYMWIGYGYMGAGVTKYNIKTGWSKHFTNLRVSRGITYSVGGITGIAVTKKHVWLVGGEEVICMNKKDRIVERFTVRNGLPSHKAFSIAATDIGILVGYMGYGFSVINDDTLEIENHKLLIDPKKYDDYLNRYSPTSFIYRDGELYMGTMESDVLKYLFGGDRVHRLLHGSIKAIDVKKVGDGVWACEAGGLGFGRVFEMKKGNFKENKDIDNHFIDSEDIIDIPAHMGQSIIFATSQRYIYCWNLETDRLKRIRLRNALFGYYYLEAFYFDGEFFWVGFQNGAQVIPKDVLLDMLEENGEEPPLGMPEEAGPFSSEDGV